MRVGRSRRPTRHNPITTIGMEIIENDKPGRNRTVEIIRPRNLFIGIILILAGILWLLNNFGLLSDSAFELIFSWHMLVVLIGTYLLSLSRWIPGGIVTAIGILLLLVDRLCLDIPFEKIIFPLLFIFAGIFLILNRRNRN